MKRICVFQGVTGSGKTTASQYLQTWHGFTEFHPYGFRKRELEDLYNPPGDLESMIGKNYIPPGMNITLHQLMIEEYKFYKRIDPHFTARRLNQDLNKMIALGESIAVVSIRSLAEVNKLMRSLVFAEYEGYTLYFFDIYREDSTRRESDELNEEISIVYENAFPDRYFKIENRVKDSFCMQVRSICDLTFE